MLGGSFHSSFWGREILLTALYSPPIRHLVVALGATYEMFENGGDAGVGCELISPQRPRAALDKLEFSLEQCNRSISHLAALMPTAPAAEKVCCLLTASILFTFVATLRGHMGEAMSHIMAAVKMLQDYDASHPEGPESPSSPGGPPGFPVPMSRLRGLVISEYGQLRAMMDDVARRGGDGPDLLVTDIKPVAVFVSVGDAHTYIEELFHNTLAFLQRAELFPPKTPAELAAVVARHKRLCEVLKWSEDALDALEEDQKRRPLTRGVGLDEEQSITVLRIHHQILAVRLRIDVLHPETRESAFDEMESELEQILVLCEKAMALDGERGYSSQQKRWVSTSGLGYILPLHTIMARCRNPILRRRALNLMLQSSRRDGIWDGVLTGRVAAQTIAIEEERMALSKAKPGSALSDEGRVREVKVEPVGERGANLRFVIVGHGEVESSIEW